MLYRIKNGTVTKYVYGLGLIGEETQSAFKTYHFDSRGSTVAVTNASGTVTDTFAYDAYGNLLSRTGTSEVIFGYCGKFGVITDENGLVYMRARYYVPEMRRFVNADLLAGGIADIASLNRYAYANGNPISNIDPYGLSPWDLVKGAYRWAKEKVEDAAEWVSDKASEIGRAVTSAATTATAVVTSVAVKAGEMIADGANAIVDTATKIKDNVVDTAVAAGNKIKDAGVAVGNWASDTSEKVVDWSKETTKNVIKTTQKMFYNAQESFSTAGSWINNNIINPVSEFLTDNWDIILGATLVVAAITVSIATFGSAALIGMAAGAAFGAAFGALGAAANGTNVLQGTLAGATVGAFGGINPAAASLGAAGMSLISDRVNGKEAGLDSLARAGISGVTAGVFSKAGSAFTSIVTDGSKELAVNIGAGVIYGLAFSSYSFMADAIIGQTIPF